MMILRRKNPALFVYTQFFSLYLQCKKVLLMNIEEKVRLFLTEYSVEIVDSLPDSEDGSIRYGECVYEERVIRIARLNSFGEPYPRVHMILTLYHEIMHAIFDEGQYGDESDCEPMVEWVAKCLTSIYMSGVVEKVDSEISKL